VKNNFFREQFFNRSFFKINFTFLIYYFSLFFLLISQWTLSLNKFSNLKSYIDFFVDVIKPIYQASESLNPFMTSQVMLFADALKVALKNVFIFLIITIFLFSLLRGLRDWWLLDKKFNWWLLVIIIFLMNLFLSILLVFAWYKLHNFILISILTIVYFILIKFMILLIEKIFLKLKLFIKDYIKLLLTQLISWLSLLIVWFVVLIVLSMLFNILPVISFILFFIFSIIILTIREYYLLNYLRVDK
jgi:hypothetical protein